MTRWIHAGGHEHLAPRRDHRRRSAQVVFTILRIRVIFQILVENNLVDEANVALPVIFRERV